MREALAIAGLHFYSADEVPAYEQVKADYENKGYKAGPGFLKKVQAEDTSNTSHSTIYPMYDKSGAGTEPSDPTKIRLNTVGQWNWSFPGQWISWKAEVPSDGLYRIAIKARQNFINDTYSTRSLTIDGKLPFKEMGNIKFPYNNNWYVKVLADENNDPYLFYLTKGTHELKLEVVAGDMAETFRSVEEIVYDLNYLYRRIIMITGASSDIGEAYGPDLYRDYRLEEKIPGLMDDFRAIIAELARQKERYQKISMGSGSGASILDEISHQLSGFVKEPDTIPQRLENFKSNISSLGAWILDMRQQPLELDYLTVQSVDHKVPSANADIFTQTYFGFNTFLASFSKDYNSIGSIYKGESSLNVWVIANDPYITGVSVGRDQAQLIKTLIDELYTAKTGVGVNLSLVDSPQTLIQATLAGKGPDVALFLPKETPVNLAMRGALYDLSKMAGYDQLMSRFMESAAIPFEYEGGHYAVPDTQDFYMLFYRKDIFNEMGLSAPNTWQDFYDIIPVIQKNNMQIGIQPESQQVFQTLLFQRGSNFYAEDKKSTDLDKPGALEAFKEWTGFYTSYSFPLKFDFFNRFRTGEMPVGIMPYSTYNLLSVGAPELRNLWEMVPIPGTVQPDGSINRSVSSNGTGSIILKGAKDPEAAFTFLEWWTSADVQARYGNELESLMGPAARYNTANVEAFKRLAWSKTEAEKLTNQWESVWDIPQLPGNYYAYRNVLFAFRKVVYDNENVREVLNRYNIEINKEITRKREEFKLD
jgi:ABC-type glycerol-3-phosphate transport system substrate-binding protein